MFSPLTFWLTALGCLVGGAVVGWLLTRAMAPAERRQRELEQRLEEAQKALRDYRHEVTEHFKGTAERVNRLTEDYRELHTHLAAGALGLCEDEGAGSEVPLLTSLGAPDYDAGAPVAATTMKPPLDYAPRRSPDEPGILNEGYDLPSRG